MHHVVALREPPKGTNAFKVRLGVPETVVKICPLIAGTLVEKIFELFQADLLWYDVFFPEQGEVIEAPFYTVELLNVAFMDTHHGYDFRIIVGLKCLYAVAEHTPIELVSK